MENWGCTNPSNCQSRGGVFRCSKHLDHTPPDTQAEEKKDAGDASQKNPSTLEQLVNRTFSSASDGNSYIIQAARTLQSFVDEGYPLTMKLDAGSDQLRALKRKVQSDTWTDFAKSRHMNDLQATIFASIVESIT